MKIIFVIFMLSLGNMIAMNYYTIYDVKGKIAKYYYIKQDENIYKSNSIYIKTRKIEDLSNAEITIQNILKANYIDDFNIIELKRPFTKLNNLFLKSNNLSKIINLRFSCSENSWLISKILQESGEFEYVIPERIYKFSSINSNDPLNDKTKYLDSLKASEVWEFVKGDSSVTIGIVDSGVMIKHEDLTQTIKINHGEIPYDGKDNDNNGFIDDYFGWDFVGDVSAIELFNGNLKPDNDVTPNDKYNNHGTHVAGIACAETNNNKGISSLGYALSYIPVKVSADNISQLNYVEKPFEGILYALNRGADVINCSWLDDDYNPLAQDIIDEVVSRGSVVVCAAGNESLDNFNYPFISPASLENVIAVGAANLDNSPAPFTHYGWNVDLFAPGVSIYSTIMENKYDTKSGTSMSSPIVASLIGLIKKLHPDWSFEQIELQLRANASKIQNYSESDSTRYWGSINPLKTLENNFKQNKSNPGLSINEYFFDDVREMNEINKEYRLNLELKNFLSDANNISLQLIPLVDYIDIDNKGFAIQSLANDKSTEITINIKLSSKTPYFEGSIPLLAIIKADDYRNLEIINIPYKIESSTKFLAAQYFADYQDNGWLVAKSPSKYSLWLIGKKHTNGRGIIYSYGYSYDPIYTTKNPTAIFPFDNKRALVALKSGNINELTEIALTKNAGLSFTTIDKPFSEVYDIHFFDDNNGVVFGSNNSSYFGIKTSNDGGNSWQFLFEKPIDANEKIVNQAYKNNKSIFITSNNNLYYSDSLAKKFVKLERYNFSNLPDKILLSNNNTILTLKIYNNNVKVIYTSNLGNSWNERELTFSSSIIDAFFLENTEIIYCLLETGEIIYTRDYFETYNFILNKDTKFGKLYLGTDFVDSCGIRLWQMGYHLYFSDIENANPTELKILAVAGSDKIIFDTLEVNQASQSQILFSTNLGKSAVEIKENNFSDNSKGSFKLEKRFPKYINPCQLYDAKVIFEPKTPGWHYDTLTITSNSDNLDIQYFLSGFAFDPTSIKVDKESKIIISPNPAENFINITSDVLNSIKELNIYDMLGVMQNAVKLESLNSTPSKYRIDVSNLSRGIYILKIGNKVEKFVKL